MKTLCLLILCTAWLPLTAFANALCQPKEPITKWFDAQYASSGNTIIVNNQRVRLNGLYAPQIERKQKFHTPGEPLAKEAQTFLNKLLANNKLKVGLVYDENDVDHFGRALAHAFLEDGTNIQAEMIRAGFAVVRTIEDNTLFNECYFDAERWARTGQYQLWDRLEKFPDSHFPLVKSSELTSADQGYRIIRGQVVLAKEGSSHFLINMDTTGIRIAKKDLYKFDERALRDLKGKTIEVRGYAYLYKNSMYMVIENPQDIDLFQPKP